MFINKIVLNNFRVYKGENIINLFVSDAKNVSIITGNNGFGKTSLLTSLVWCLYGKLMADVDDRYKKEIYESGGYKLYCQKLLNKISLDEYETKEIELTQQSKKATETERREIDRQIKELYSFSVSVEFKKIFIPVIPCDVLEIRRTYHIKTQIETLEIFIDGQVNELTKEVGPEIFINDFILRKEIAKFFFFDAEKIVELAEISTLEDRRNLSKAYSEVLGIKKYLDLKNDLENLRYRLKKRSSTSADRDRLEKLQKQMEQNKKMIEHQNILVQEKSEELKLKRLASDKFQEKLIREGSSISLEELKEFKQMKEHIQQEMFRLKNRMKEMIDLAPLAIAASKLSALKNQIESEQELKDKKNNDALLKRKNNALKKSIIASGFALNAQKKQQLFDIIEDTLLPKGNTIHKPLLDFTAEQENHFFAVYDHLQSSFVRNFKTITSELKIQNTSLSLISRKLSNAESKENDPVIKAIRNDKNLLDAAIIEIENECIDLKAKTIVLQTEQNNLSSQVSELQKRVNVEDIDKAKDETAARLINELEAFVYKLKIKKKQSLEEKILQELNILMHKRNLVKKVEVVIEGDLIDIDLYDKRSKKIDKNSLSKGEQQLYATALLKALVEESHIRFPVFIDSPLQKFDKAHAKNIIRDFYPYVSAQVILFPLLEKELNEEEFRLLYPKIADCYIIEHRGQYESAFKAVKPEDLYTVYQKQMEHVYSN